MKSYLLIIGLLSFIHVNSQDEKFINQMGKHIDAVYKAQTTEEFLGAINAFNRIGDAEKTKWEPFYYASFGYIMLATREADGGKKDAYLDQAKSALDKAAAILSNDSEIIAMEGFIHMIRLTVDPATRGPQYSMMSMQAFNKAVSLNPNNPRALSLMAQMQLGTARFFNQAPTEACATGRKALELFNASPVSDNKLVPAWGKGMTESMVANCQ